MSAIADLEDNFREPLDPYGAVTHEVFNQPVELVDINLYDSDAALKEAVSAKARAGRATRSAPSAPAPGRPNFWSSGRSRIRTRPSSTPTIATAGGSTSSASIRPITR